MSIHLDPESVIQAQLDAYNARDMAAWLATYAPDAKQYAYPGVLLASGHAEIRARMTARFTETNLHARLLSRKVLKTAEGATVIDHETITRTFPEGPGELDMVAIYEVAGGLIRSGLFIGGEARLIDPF
ncbi:nuclear transport factor 2 family protein [Roseateles oligotrophus]|uniref:Nuclear transport factor 2 family protein n=1 Tax=Roseateles oligotrophus TaxID=1769250 RepID=A0ABT2YHZ4_9BURK|nr:nuclear transport factor 2 family protein [Roseateles oligotrophus]MCV2369684.1 nuclear transport factor 2 family protein [Roseateles oligotrophus]